MKTVITFLLLLIVALPLKASPQAWREFSSTEGNFAVLMPGTPSDQSTETDMRFKLNVGPRTFAIVRTDKFDRADTIDKTLNNLADGLMQVSQGKQISKTNLTLSGNPGVAIKYETT